MKLDPVRIQLDEYANQDWTITVEKDTTLENVLAAEFFGNVARDIRPYDHIRVRTDTGEWYAELLVTSCGPTWAKTIVLAHIDLVARDVEISQSDCNDDYFVKFRGPHLKFCVIRKSDSVAVKEEIPTQAEAQAWLASYVITH